MRFLFLFIVIVQSWRDMQSKGLSFSHNKRSAAYVLEIGHQCMQSNAFAFIKCVCIYQMRLHLSNAIEHPTARPFWESQRVVLKRASGWFWWSKIKFQLFPTMYSVIPFFKDQRKIKYCHWVCPCARSSPHRPVPWPLFLGLAGGSLPLTPGDPWFGFSSTFISVQLFGSNLSSFSSKKQF